jgi:hypothetical protein
MSAMLAIQAMREEGFDVRDIAKRFDEALEIRSEALVRYRAEQENIMFDLRIGGFRGQYTKECFPHLAEFEVDSEEASDRYYAVASEAIRMAEKLGCYEEPFAYGDS